MTQVLLVPRNPLDLRPEDLEPLAEQIRQETALPVDIHVTPQRGYGVTWWEVLEIVISAKILEKVLDKVLDKVVDTAVGHPIQLLLDKITEKVKHWYGERRVERRNNRPLSLTFRDEEGNELRKVELHAPDETENVKAKDRKKPGPRSKRKNPSRRSKKPPPKTP